MSSEENPPPTTEERYSSATHATSLKCEIDHTAKFGQAEVLIAAAWSESHLGAALMRLHSEFDGAEKPQKVDARGMAALARMIAKENKRVVPNDADMRQTRAMAAQWLLHELKIQLGKLKTLPDVRAQLVAWAKVKNLQDPQDLVADVLMWWLDSTCPVCHGRRWQVIEGTPALSERACPECGASGSRDRPGGMEGGMLMAHIDRCMGEARVSMRRRLRVHQESKG